MGKNRLEELRDAQGLQRAEVAVACSVGEAQIRRWESGEVLVPSRHLPALCALFGVSTEVLMGWDRVAA